MRVEILPDEDDSHLDAVALSLCEMLSGVSIETAKDALKSFKGTTAAPAISLAVTAVARSERSGRVAHAAPWREAVSSQRRDERQPQALTEQSADADSRKRLRRLRLIGTSCYLAKCGAVVLAKVLFIVILNRCNQALIRLLSP